MKPHRLALITGAGRRIGIGAAVARSLAADGWDIAVTRWTDYDRSMPWGADDDHHDWLDDLDAFGARTLVVEADLSQAGTPAQVFRSLTDSGHFPSALVLNHCHSVDSGILDTSLESFDRHFAVNARASWLLIREFAQAYQGSFGDGRILSITSDHTAGNLPYGASKGAMDRIVLAAAEELQELGITANVVNPGATDTGWMSAELMETLRKGTFLRRVGQPQDAANLIRFLCSPDGGWINGQLLYSNGGLH